MAGTMIIRKFVLSHCLFDPTIVGAPLVGARPSRTQWPPRHEPGQPQGLPLRCDGWTWVNAGGEVFARFTPIVRKRQFQYLPNCMEIYICRGAPCGCPALPRHDGHRRRPKGRHVDCPKGVRILDLECVAQLASNQHSWHICCNVQSSPPDDLNCRGASCGRPALPNPAVMAIQTGAITRVAPTWNGRVRS